MMSDVLFITFNGAFLHCSISSFTRVKNVGTFPTAGLEGRWKRDPSVPVFFDPYHLWLIIFITSGDICFIILASGPTE